MAAPGLMLIGSEDQERIRTPQRAPYLYKPFRVRRLLLQSGFDLAMQNSQAFVKLYRYAVGLLA